MTARFGGDDITLTSRVAVDERQQGFHQGGADQELREAVQNVSYSGFRRFLELGLRSNNYNKSTERIERREISGWK